ncbi:dienelactone hydrolase family protein [Amycolatopsis sp. La24]|uniref:alpha/beta hydrolase family protein n=1 Tax=Amycolatopsis sp. La24 TaxID=3028304 RepID=UPI0023B11F3C|nr:dienelactone hydrolase family protein [Amycolatopsis sp. La24]
MRFRTVLAAALLLTALGAAPAAAETTFELPTPTGPHAIGERDVHLVDSARDRELMISVWYPTRPGAGPKASYLPAAAASYFDQGAAPALGLPTGKVDWAAVRTHARANAPVQGRWPVIVYSPGWASLRALGSATAEDLASRGYIVVTIDHTGEAPFVVFPDGRVVFSQQSKDLVAGMRTRVADVRFTLDQLPGIPGLGKAMDLSRVGVIGHSFGGDTAAEVSTVDSRVDAAADLDGWLAYDVDGKQLTRAGADGVTRPVLLMGSSGSTSDGQARSHRTSPAWKSLWEHTSAPKQDITLATAMHYSYTDVQWFLPKLAQQVPVDPKVQETRIGTIDPRVSITVQRSAIAEFFGQYVSRRP